ncbi:hypothetical protein RND81_10G018300 [Saponaria officinalis]|uniref:Pentatricopeptide repeat-containing protein n=1 Tax=Saponaria officinalis TaxID=3572 RepID=A0AAW1HY79_SAPOF
MKTGLSHTRMMFSIFRRTVPIIKQTSLLIHQLAVDESSHTLASSLCESLRKGLDWNTLSRTYEHMNLNDCVIETVLTEFKEPLEAKKALSFFHWVAHNKNVTHDLKAYCIMIHILARAHLVIDSRGLLQSVLTTYGESKTECSSRFVVVEMLLSTYRMTNACPFVFELLVQTYSKLGMFETAFDVCCYLDEHGFSLSLVTFNTLVHVVQKSDDKSGFIWKVYEHFIKKRMNPNQVTIRIMINALCKAGELQTFVDIIDRIHGKRSSPSVIVNTSLVYRILRDGKIQEGILILKTMLQKNMILDTISYSFIVYARLKSGELKSAREIYREMLQRGFEPNSFVYTVFIESYCEEGMVKDALNLMDEMVSIGLKPYDETYNTLIMGCAKIGDLTNIVRLFDEMTKIGMLPSASTFNKMVEKLCVAGNMKQANEMLTVLIEKGFSPDVTPYSYMIDGYGKERNIQEVLKLYYEMEFRSLSPGLSIFRSLIRTLCDCGMLEEADKYLSVMKSRSLCPTVCIYEPLIVGLLERGCKERASQLYDEVLQKGLQISHTISGGFVSEDLES